MTFDMWGIDDGFGRLLETRQLGYTATPQLFNTKAEAQRFALLDTCRPENMYASLPQPWPKIKIRRVDMLVKFR